MAVFTEATRESLAPWLGESYGLELSGGPEPITEGIENTNYTFVAAGGKRYVFTVFEVWDRDMAAYCLSLAAHLSAAGHPVPRALPASDGSGLCASYSGKPAAVVEFVEGAAKRNPSPGDCGTIAGHLAGMHLSVGDFAPRAANKRGFEWREGVIPKVRGTLSGGDAELLDAAAAVDRDVAGENLPEGACHCDLFRNNVLWAGDSVAGIIDFYFAGHDRLSFDLAVAAVDWTMDDLGALNRESLVSLLRGYLGRRPMGEAERRRFPDMMAVAALRFWLSRTDDHVNPRESLELVEHDPSAFRHRLAACLSGRGEIAGALDDALS